LNFGQGRVLLGWAHRVVGEKPEKSRETQIDPQISLGPIRCFLVAFT
jgi:hypothetical protein